MGYTVGLISSGSRADAGPRPAPPITREPTHMTQCHRTPPDHLPAGTQATTHTVFSVASRLNRLPILPLHRRATAVIGLGLFFDLYEVFLAGILSTILTRNFHVTSTQLPWLLSSAFIGAFIGAC